MSLVRALNPAVYRTAKNPKTPLEQLTFVPTRRLA
jgi:hypothetical protein